TASSSRPPGEVAKGRRTKRRRTMMLAISSATLLLAQTPHVELNFNVMNPAVWTGRRFDEIIPAAQLKRIVCPSEGGSAPDAGPSDERAFSDPLLAHLRDAPAPATRWSLEANEGTPRDLAALTGAGETPRIEVVGTPGTSSSATAILVHGKGRAAR